MTAIVTIDQVVPALTADLNSSTEAEKAALRAALGASTDTGGGGTTTPTPTPTASETFLYEITATQSISSSWVGTRTVPIVTPLTWNNPVSTASYGTFNGSKFTFNRKTRALVSFGVTGALIYSGTATFSNHAFRFQLSLTANGTKSSYYGAQNMELFGSFTVSGASNSIVREFNPGDTVSVDAIIWTEGLTVNNTSFYGWRDGQIESTFKSFFSVAEVR